MLKMRQTPEQWLYDPRFEHDNCGIGAVVNIKGIKTRETVDNALKIVENLKHRAGKDAEGKTGDGVGILLQISHKFFQKAAKAAGITLGGERDMLESMQMDTLDMAIVTSGPFINFSDAMGVLDMPYLFGSNEEAYAVLDGEIGRELLDTLEDSGLKGLAYAERGFRNLTNNVKPIQSAADLNGLKLRVMENDVYTASFKAMGVNADPMAWADALTALQQGTVDGQENPINVIYSYKLWESQKYATLDRHSYSTAIITMSANLFNSLDAETQQIFLDAAQEAAEFERAWVAEQEADQLQAMKDNGMEVIEDPDLDSFKEAVQPVYEQYSQYADYVSRIQEVIAGM